MTTSRHTHFAREVGFFVEAALSPASVASVEWADNGGTVEIYYTADPIQTIRGIATWTQFTKPGSSGTFDAPLGTRKIAIEATSADAQDPSSVTVVRDGVGDMEQARLYGVDQLDSPIVVPPQVAAKKWTDPADLNNANRVQNRYFNIGVDAANIVNGRLGTFSCWVKPAPDQGQPGQAPMMMMSGDDSAATSQFRFSTEQGGDELDLIIGDNTGGLGITIGATDVIWNVGEWVHFLASWNYTTPAVALDNLSLYINDTLVTQGVNGGLVNQGNGINPLQYEHDRWSQGFIATSQASIREFRGCMAVIYVNFEERMDLDIEANRRKFRSAGGGAVLLGADGSAPTGQQPAFYAADGNLTFNAGKSVNLDTDFVNLVTDCDDGPPAA